MSNRRFPRPLRKKGVIAAARLQRHPQSEPRLEFRSDERIRRFVRPFLIALLATSVAIAMLVIVEVIYPESRWQLIALLAFFSALEGSYTVAWLENPASRPIDRSAYRVAEVLVLVVLARIFSWVVFAGFMPTRADIQVFLTSPLAFLMIGNFFTTLIVMLLSWWLSVSVSKTFSALDISNEEYQFYTLSEANQKDQADNRPIQTPRDELQTKYLTIFLSVGMGLVIMAAMSTYEVREFATVSNPFEFTRIGLRTAMLWALLLYFLSGLWLLSHARLLRINARWLMDGIAKDADLERNWQRYSLILILVIAFFAAFLPIGSTLAISRLMGMMIQGVGFLASSLFGLFAFFFASILALISESSEATDQVQREPIPTIPPPSPVEQLPPNPLFSMLASSIFWTLIIAVIIGATVFVLRERGYRVQLDNFQTYLSRFSIWFNETWHSMRHRVRATGRSLRRQLQFQTEIQSFRPTKGEVPRRFIRINALSPRDQIRFYYLSTVRRAGDIGIRRRINETPLEYFEDLTEVWPEAEHDLKALTGSFLEARYSRKLFEKKDVNSVREGWKRLKARLRNPVKSQATKPNEKALANEELNDESPD
jgi:hypothetical protein